MSDKRRKRVILVVDDDEMIVEIMREVFKEYGFFVFGAKCSDNLYRILHSINPDLIIMDYWIKGDENGADVIRALQAEKQLRKIPVLFTTGDEFKSQTENLPVRKINKPYELEELIHAVLDMTDEEGR